MESEWTRNIDMLTMADAMKFNFFFSIFPFQLLQLRFIVKSYAIIEMHNEKSISYHLILLITLVGKVAYACAARQKTIIMIIIVADWKNVIFCKIVRRV